MRDLDPSASVLAFFGSELRRSRLAVASFADAPDVAYLDTVVRGQLADRRADVAECSAVFDVLQAVALAPEASLDLVARIRKES